MFLWLACAPVDAPLTAEQEQRQKYAGCTYVTDVDDGADGTVDHGLAGAFDDLGWPVRFERSAADGRLEYEVVSENDPFGNPLTYTEDYDADGVIDYRRVGKYTADGVRRSIDEDLLYQDDEFDLRTTYDLRRGALVSGERRALDPALAALDEDYAYETDERGRVLTFERWSPGQGALLQRIRSTWVGEWPGVEVVEDWADGAIASEVTTTWTRDGADRLVAQEIVAEQSGAPPTTWSTTYVYGGDGERPDTAETVVTSAGLELQRDAFSWVYDDGWRALVYRTPTEEQTTTWTCDPTEPGG